MAGLCFLSWHGRGACTSAHLPQIPVLTRSKANAMTPSLLPMSSSVVRVSRFLEHFVRTEKQPLPALETARSALELLYGPVLGMDLGELPRPQPPGFWTAGTGLTAGMPV